MKRIVNVEGVDIVVEDKLPAVGELYIGERNDGPKLLIARELDYERRLVIPEGINYPYSFGECKRVHKDSL